MTPIEKYKFEAVTNENRKIIYISGTIDEDTNFNPLLDFGKTLILNLSKIASINSCGIRNWVNFFKDLNNTQVIYEECTPLLVRQMNMIPSFLGKAHVASVFVPYLCATCEEEKIILVKEDKFNGGNIKIEETLVCEKCQKGEMEFDGKPKQYFAFTK